MTQFPTICNIRNSVRQYGKIRRVTEMVGCIAFPLGIPRLDSLISWRLAEVDKPLGLAQAFAWTYECRDRPE